MHTGLVDDVGLEGLWIAALASVVADEHDLHVLLVWMVLGLLAVPTELWVRFALPGVGVSIATEFDLLDPVVAADFGRLLVVEAAAADGSADAALNSNHLVGHVLVWTLVRVSQLLVHVAAVRALILGLCLCSCRSVGAVVGTANIPVGLRHGGWSSDAAHAAN